jgi:hypothetical protein
MYEIILFKNSIVNKKTIVCIVWFRVQNLNYIEQSEKYNIKPYSYN